MPTADGWVDRLPESILLVDDSPANLRLLSQILGERGYGVRAVTGGPRALASIELTPPDLILLDIRMPDMDGFEVCAQLKASPKTAGIPVLFISALDDIQDKMRAFSTGAVDYITKPFQLEEVIARVETHLALRRLQRNLLEANERMARELTLAAQVQASFMQRNLPTVPGWQMAVSLIPARTTSGDFYDVVELPGGKLGFLIADVVDKGVGAALYMAMSCALLRAYTGEHPAEPGLACQAVNARLLEYATADQFVTVFLAVLDPESGLLTYSNAGHNPPIWLRSNAGGQVQLLRNTGLPLGVIEGGAWQSQAVQMTPGDVLVLYTDGITDAESAEGVFYDLSRLVETISAHAGETAAGVRDAILDELRRFTRGAVQSDDMAVMVLVRQQTGP
jgi:sigma-B regulation protein RsbU (phosphoserine phosphatase)